MRVETERVGFGLGVGEGRVTRDKHSCVDVLLDVDLLHDLHKLGEADSNASRFPVSAISSLLLSRADALGVATRPQGKPSVA
jgi:hypothetical protein